MWALYPALRLETSLTLLIAGVEDLLNDVDEVKLEGSTSSGIVNAPDHYGII